MDYCCAAMNAISSLLRQPFSVYSLDDKLKIKSLGRPLPDLKIVQKQNVKSKEIVRKFSRGTYSKNDWICGCGEKNAFFCFPCVLFGSEEAWCKHGVADLIHIAAKIKKHEASIGHVNSVFSFKILGKTNIQMQLSSQYRQTLLRKNEEIAKNRYVFSKIINCIKFCGSFELSLRGHDEKDDSSNKGVFKELLSFSADLDSALKDHLEKSTVFKGTSKIIQNEILECMLEVYHEEVRKEVAAVDYVSIIADETTDSACQFQLVTILRYVKNGLPVERFWKFVLPDGHNSASLATCILNELDSLLHANPNKLIAQSYDGAAVMSGSINGVQKKIRDKYPYANFVHCYAHQANLILEKATSVNKNVRIFFANLTGLCAFFSTSPQRTKVLESIVQKRLPRACPTRWNFQSRGIHTVYENRADLIQVMDVIQNSDDITLQATISQASAHERLLRDEKFIFWLSLFQKIMPHVDVLFNQLQQKISDPTRIKSSVKLFKDQIQKIRNDILDGESPSDNSSEHFDTRRKRNDNDQATIKREAVEVCDTIICQINDRFGFIGHLIAANLFVTGKFADYVKSFPEDYLVKTVEVYPFLNINQLRTELQVLYMREELRGASGAVPLIRLLLEQGLDSIFTETVKLLNILITIPMSSSEAERCFSMLKRVKTFLRNTMNEDRLNALGMLSFEKILFLE